MSNQIQVKELLEAIKSFVNQRPNLDPANYNSVSSYQKDANSVSQARRKALVMIAIAQDSMVDVEDFRRTKPSRITLEQKDGAIEIGYMAGQYYPTEYRRAALEWVSDAMAYHLSHLPDSVYRDSKLEQIKSVLGPSLYKSYFHQFVESMDNKSERIAAILDPEGQAESRETSTDVSPSR